MVANMEYLSENEKRRFQLSGIFSKMEKESENRLADILSSDLDSISDYFQNLSTDYKFLFEQVAPNAILWKDEDTAHAECLFYIVQEASDLEAVSGFYSQIRYYMPRVAYALVLQKNNGSSYFDIFKCSSSSYLEYCSKIDCPLKSN